MDFTVKDNRLSAVFKTAGTLTAVARKMRHRLVKDKPLAASKVSTAEMQGTIKDQLTQSKASSGIDIIV